MIEVSEIKVIKIPFSNMEKINDGIDVYQLNEVFTTLASAKRHAKKMEAHPYCYKAIIGHFDPYGGRYKYRVFITIIAAESPRLQSWDECVNAVPQTLSPIHAHNYIDGKRTVDALEYNGIQHRLSYHMVSEVSAQSAPPSGI